MNTAIAWMAEHKVAANLLMLFILAAGFFSMRTIVTEVFPESDLDLIQVRVQYPGASPGEVEEGIVQRIEERVRQFGHDALPKEAIRQLAAAAVRENNAVVRVSWCHEISDLVLRVENSSAVGCHGQAPAWPCGRPGFLATQPTFG